MKHILLALTGAFFASSTWAQCPKLIINEFSNGPSGSKEFFELVVLGCPGGTQDIRNWIIDDNSGRCSSCGTGTGIAAGHFRFSNSSVWQNVKVGAIIVIYNADDKSDAMPADDPNDADNDYVHIVPHTNTTYITIHSTLPSTANCNNFGTGGSGTNWANIVGMANTGDLGQVVDPANLSAVAHGVANGTPDHTSCPNVVYFSGSGAQRTYQFRNLNNDNPFRVENWSSVTVSATSPYVESPGAANNAANQNWINKLRNAAPEFVWQGTTEDGNWTNCRNWDVLSVPCGTNPDARIANTTAARNLDLATVPPVSLGNLNVAVGGSVALPGFGNCLSNTVTVNGTLTLTRGIVSTCTPASATAAVYVANSATGAVSGGSGNSFINGRLRRAIVSGATNVNYNYPLGRGTAATNYARAEARFSSTATLTELMGYYNTSADAAMTDMSGNHCGAPPTAYTNLMTGFWRFESTPAAAAPAYTMRVYPNVVFVKENVLLAKRPDGASPWKAYGCCVPPYDNNYIDRGCLTGFSDFKPQIKDTPLPVEGWEFFAEKGKTDVALKWQTAVEYGVERYEIERWDGEMHFATLGATPAAGFSRQTHSYAFSDPRPLRGENLYRIRAVDFDGAVSFSEVRSVVWDAEKGITLYPNPADDRLTVVSESAVKSLRLFDLAGKICARSEGNTLEVGALPAGVYVLEALTESGAYRQNVFKR